MRTQRNSKEILLDLVGRRLYASIMQCSIHTIGISIDKQNMYGTVQV